MTIERMIRLMASSLILISMALGVEASPLYHSAHWLWLSTFVGLNLLQSSLTGFCPPEKLFRKLGFKSAS